MNQNLHAFLLKCKTEKDEAEVSDDNVQSPPEFINLPTPIYVTKGDNAILRCQIAGQPPPSVLWSKDFESIKHGSKYKVTIIMSF